MRTTTLHIFKDKKQMIEKMSSIKIDGYNNFFMYKKNKKTIDKVTAECNRTHTRYCEIDWR